MLIYTPEIEISRAFFGLGYWELIIILVLVLIVFGAGKLPQVGGALGEGIRNFKGGLKGELKKDDEKQLEGQDGQAQIIVEPKNEDAAEKNRKG